MVTTTPDYSVRIAAFAAHSNNVLGIVRHVFRIRRIRIYAAA